jgi:hypothetical protein
VTSQTLIIHSTLIITAIGILSGVDNLHGDQFGWSLSLSALSACLRDLIFPLHIPLVRLCLPELCCQLGVIGIPQEQM